MKLLQKILLIFYFISLFNNIALSQDYLWPTNASRYLTSSFAEYRPGHFHAGLDIKTWGRIGYKVFAIRDGYIMRIWVSPFGYGKVLYQKLDSGEIAVYAHLDRFNDELESFVKQEQNRKGAYRINKYLGREQFPVKKGDVIGYTGASGIGSPHLHFEIRDPNNHPMNPFLLGYKIEDTIPPLVRAISFTPLDYYSQVNSDVIPFIEEPIRVSSGNYKLLSKVLVSGNIGFAIDCLDQADGVNNKFAVYKIDFYVDGVLNFSSKYDKFSYSVTHFVDFDRDFRLMSRGKGRFQKLYKEKFNQLLFYKPIGNEVGIIKCDPNVDNKFLMQNRLGKGEHQFIIELYDFFGNVTTVTGNFIVGDRTKIYANYRLEGPDQFYITDIRDLYGNKVDNPEIFVSSDRGISWRKMSLNFIAPDSEIGSQVISEYLLKPIKPWTVVKIESKDEHGIISFPLYYLIEEDSINTNLFTELNLETDFYDDYIRFKLNIDGLIRDVPKLFVQQIGISTTEAPLLPDRYNEFIGVYQLIPGKDGPLSIEARAIDISGQELIYWDQFDIRTVFPDRGGMIKSKDERCRVIFRRESVYKNLFLRMNQLGPLEDPKYDAIGTVYEIFPQDIPLKGAAVIELKYPASDSLPDKLGIYRIGQQKHRFSGNQINYQNNLVSCNVSNLGAFTLIRDTIPPSITIRHPYENAQLNNKNLTFLALVYDDLSGIANELSIVMKLDGKQVIAEYDPEAKTIKYEPDMPLLSGEHSISVWAIDNSKNEAFVSHKFYIIK